MRLKIVESVFNLALRAFKHPPKAVLSLPRYLDWYLGISEAAKGSFWETGNTLDQLRISEEVILACLVLNMEKQ